ncbi:MAG: hypothetical protein HY840_08325 [Bacteroidetes bacterium]|nr:hypothetical protein [Bacteroidota bacterium]
MMKRAAYILLILLIVIGTGSFLYFYNGGNLFKKLIRGKAIQEGVIEYDVTYPKVDPNSMMVSGLPSKAFLRFKNNNMVNDMSGMMGLISITYISDQTNKKVAQTLTLINKKYVSDISEEEMKKMNDSFLSSIEHGKNTQEIAGFKCKEAIVTLQNGETTHVYYTNDIGITNPNWSNPYTKIDGVLMDFQMERYGLAMHLKAKSVFSQTIDDTAFNIPEDHKKIPFAELEKILQELNPAAN